MRHIFCAAVLAIALAQVFGEDLALLGGSSLFVRRLLIYVGLFCDLFFTSQFLVGLYGASLNRKARRYFLYEGGWMDFLAAVPVLVLYSAPAVFGLVAGAPLVSGAARLSLGVRFLRFMKIFRIVPFGAAEKGLPAALVAVLITAGAFLGPVGFRGGFSESRILDGYDSSALTFASGHQEGEVLARAAREYAQTERALLLLRHSASGLYTRYEADHYGKYYGQEDYLWRRYAPFDFFFDLRPLLAEEAGRRLAYFYVLTALFSVLFISSRMRARTKRNP